MMALTLSLITSNSFAQDNSGTFFGKEATGKWIIGGKAGKIDLNAEGVNDADAAGIVLGYEFDQTIGGFGGTSTIEVEYITGDESALDDVLRYEADVLNVFFTYRTAGDLYFKVKGGLSYATVDITSDIIALRDDFEDVAIAGGLGFGYRFGDRGAIELEYSKDSGNADLSIVGVNALLKF